ncbi:head-tail joining protein [Rhodomicrobium lacus]|jgi:hypothetical protein|uniref:head-tail joining protein n=1 Tax=Rhodomicrobium lacus TaxID=2498452 RepID=UPI000F8DBDF5|nr:hypothetical protein [Rhodomicrobium lacus]
MWKGLLDDMTAAVRDTFGQAVTYTRAATGEVFDIVAPFDPAYASVEAGGSIPVTITRPVLDIRIADIGGHEPEQDDTALIGERLYRVIDAEASSSGMIKAHLRKV